jgi:hypothetical protein
MRFWHRRSTNDAGRSTTVSTTRVRWRCNILDANGPCDGVLLILILFLIVELVFFLFQYYDVYQNVYPGSKVAQNLTGGKGTAFEFFKWAICWCSGTLTVPAGFYAAYMGVAFVGKEINACLAVLIALPWIGLCIFLGTWQLWIYWLMSSVWFNSVWTHACDGWDGYAMLEGITWGDVASSLPYVGTATVFLAAGNYTMQLERNSTFHSIFYFYNVTTDLTGDLTADSIPPVYNNIIYDTRNHLYTINNTTTRYTTSPNLAFPSLDLVLSDDSIPFGSAGDMPLANLLYRNDSTSLNVLSTVNTAKDDCTQMKVCVMQKPPGDYEIALGVVMIQQYLYGVSCTTPSDDDSDSDD